MPHRILLVDDDPETTSGLHRLLTMKGYEVCEENDPTKALRVAREFQPDFVILDYLMPEMNGVEATREIRRLPGARGQVPIIALTCSGAGDLRTQCLEAGMNEFIAKPLLPHTLRRLLETWTPSSQLLEAV